MKFHLKLYPYVLLVVASFLLSACSPGRPAADTTPVSPPTVLPVTESVQEPATAASPNGSVPSLGWWQDDLPISDGQGAVEVTITPLNLNSPGETLDFEVSLNTHSVDLSMDLAALSELAASSGKKVNALEWEAPLGGHHVSGVLKFPASLDGAPFLLDEKRLSLTIVELDAPQRVFTWER